MIVKRKLFTKKLNLMKVEDVYVITNTGTTVFGKLNRDVKLGDKVSVSGAGNKYEISHIITNFRDDKSKWPKSAKTGDSVGLVLKNCNERDVKRGDILD